MEEKHKRIGYSETWITIQLVLKGQDMIRIWLKAWDLFGFVVGCHGVSK
jgi:hypothetical protein